MPSNRAREIQRMTEFEEDNLTRLMLKKKAEVMHRTVLRSVGRTKAGAIMILNESL
jgi:hypothetical protein